MKAQTIIRETVGASKFKFNFKKAFPSLRLMNIFTNAIVLDTNAYSSSFIVLSTTIFLHYFFLFTTYIVTRTPTKEKKMFDP